MGLTKKIQASLEQFEAGMKQEYEERQQKLEAELKKILPEVIKQVVKEELDRRGYVAKDKSMA